MKFPKLIVATIATVVTMTIALAGCSASSPGPGPAQAEYVGIVMGNTAYAPSVTKASFRSLLQQAVSPGTHLVVYSSEGVPRELFDGVISWDQSAQHSSASFAAEMRKIESAVIGQSATNAQSNPLEAIMKIVGRFPHASASKEILVLDPMLNTAGAVKLQDGSLYGAPSDTVTFLRTTNYLPPKELKGVRIVFTETGAVGPNSKQPVLDSVSTRRLVDFWSQIVRAGGGTSTTASASFGAPTAGDQPVAIVLVTPIDQPVVNCSVALDGTQVAFEADSARLIDPSASAAVLASAATRLKAAGCSGKVTLVGTTSSGGTAASRTRVADARALAVRALLAKQLSVAPETIATKAAGYDLTYCAKDTDAAGILLPALAARCRLVIVTVG